MEWIIPMIAGLLLDISAVYIILKKNLFLKLRFPSVGGKIPKNASDEEREKLMQKYYNDEFLRTLRHSFNDDLEIKDWTKWGLSFLMIGFLLQLIANVINYYDL